MAVKNKVKVDKKDVYRALLTDTMPGDVPVIYSNDGLYINLQKHKSSYSFYTNKFFNSLFQFLLKKKGEDAIPYRFSIARDSISLRTLSLIHPKSQLASCAFYADNADSVTFLCSKSKASIRAPSKVSNSLYAKDSIKSNKYKEINIETLQDELERKHASSFFSYRGYSHIYKFFNNIQYIELEKQFSHMWLLDVSNCFDSIYTHSVAWAAKNKEYAKEHKSFYNQFCDNFDKLMQGSNNGETNGIPIGAEISRIFAEIIFQDIDCKIINELELKHNYSFEKDYAFFRFVDDFMVFSTSNEEIELIAKTIADNLANYNLYLNEKKVEKYVRPFNTKKSALITEIKSELSSLQQKVIQIHTINGKKISLANPIRNQLSLKKHFINRIKLICRRENGEYSDISSYLISSVANYIVNLTDDHRLAPAKHYQDTENAYNLRDALFTFIDLLFFFYTVNPQVTPSNKLAKSIIITDNFFEKNYPDFLETFRTRVSLEVRNLAKPGSESRKDTLVSLETLNILLSTSNFGTNYLLPQDSLTFIISRKPTPSYFEIVSLLFYIKHHEEYLDLKDTIERYIWEVVSQGRSFRKDSEICHLLLDSLSCPYLSQSLRLNLLNLYLAEEGMDNTTSEKEKEQLLANLQDTYWFVNWKTLNILKLLERRELSKKY